MSWNDHDHKGDYAEPGHYHDIGEIHGGCEDFHSHRDLERQIASLNQDNSTLRDRVSELEAYNRIATANAHGLAMLTGKIAQIVMVQAGAPDLGREIQDLLDQLPKLPASFLG